MASMTELQEECVNLGADKSSLPRTKSELEKLLDKLKKTDKVDITFEAPEPSKELSRMSDALPVYGSLEWQKYVLSLLRPDEVIDGFPKGAGLRRVAGLLLGPIVKSGASQISVVPQLIGGETPSRAVTINYEITIDWRLDRSVYINQYVQQTVGYRTFAGVSDCVEDTRNVFGKHPAASAESKAESRALKKALGLNVLSFEERISGYEESVEIEKSSDKISKQLRDFISAKIETLKLDVNQVMKDFGRAGMEVGELNMDEGRKLFQFINTYQQR